MLVSRSGIVCRTAAEIDRMRPASRLVAAILGELSGMVQPGVTTADLDRVAEVRIAEAGAQALFKGYQGYPATICVSVNEQVIHGIPSSRRLVEGDIVSIDVGARLNGYCGDAAVTVPVGKIPEETARLLDVTEAALHDAIRTVRPGARLGDIGHAVQRLVESHGFSVVREFVGHGIGESMHEEPQIPNFGDPGRGTRLEKGMTLAIEPMVNMGGAAVRVLRDGWTAVTRDGSLSAHFEHTIAVTDTGALVLTMPGGARHVDGGSKKPVVLESRWRKSTLSR
ncbi:MAG: type I methionyl aminopeptidase [Vicinamibacterales bacterium]